MEFAVDVDACIASVRLPAPASHAGSMLMMLPMLPILCTLTAGPYRRHSQAPVYRTRATDPPPPTQDHQEGEDSGIHTQSGTSHVGGDVRGTHAAAVLGSCGWVVVRKARVSACPNCNAMQACPVECTSACALANLGSPQWHVVPSHPLQLCTALTHYPCLDHPPCVQEERLSRRGASQGRKLQHHAQSSCWRGRLEHACLAMVAL